VTQDRWSFVLNSKQDQSGSSFNALFEKKINLKFLTWAYIYLPVLFKIYRKKEKDSILGSYCTMVVKLKIWWQKMIEIACEYQYSIQNHRTCDTIGSDYT